MKVKIVLSWFMLLFCFNIFAKDVSMVLVMKDMKYFPVAKVNNAISSIDEKKYNPTLKLHKGDKVNITVVQGDSEAHDIAIEEICGRTDKILLQSKMLLKPDETDKISFTFNPKKDCEYYYYCTSSGHRLESMEGDIEVKKVISVDNKKTKEL